MTIACRQISAAPAGRKRQANQSTLRRKRYCRLRCSKSLCRFERRFYTLMAGNGSKGRSAKRWPVMTILESWKTLPEKWIALLQLLGALVQLRDERLTLLSRISFYAQCCIKLQTLEQLQHLMGDEISICLTEVHNQNRSADAFVVEFVTFRLNSLRPLKDLQTDLANKLHNLAAVWKSQQTGSAPGCLSAPPNIPGVKLKVKVEYVHHSCRPGLVANSSNRQKCTGSAGRLSKEQAEEPVDEVKLQKDYRDMQDLGSGITIEALRVMQQQQNHAKRLRDFQDARRQPQSRCAQPSSHTCLIALFDKLDVLLKVDRRTGRSWAVSLYKILTRLCQDSTDDSDTFERLCLLIHTIPEALNPYTIPCGIALIEMSVPGGSKKVFRDRIVEMNTELVQGTEAANKQLFQTAVEAFAAAVGPTAFAGLSPQAYRKTTASVPSAGNAGQGVSAPHKASDTQQAHYQESAKGSRLTGSQHMTQIPADAATQASALADLCSPEPQVTFGAGDAVCMDRIPQGFYHESLLAMSLLPPASSCQTGSGQTARAAGVTIPAPAPTALGSQLSRTAARPPKIPNRYTVPPKAFYESSASRLSQPPPSCSGQVTSTMRKATAPKAQAGSHSAIDDSAINNGAMDDGAMDDSAIDDRAIDDSTEHRLSPAGADTPSPAEADLAATPGARAVTPAATLQGAPAAFGSPVRSMWPPRPATDSLVKPAQAEQQGSHSGASVATPLKPLSAAMQAEAKKIAEMKAFHWARRRAAIAANENAALQDAAAVRVPPGTHEVVADAAVSVESGPSMPAGAQASELSTVEHDTFAAVPVDMHDTADQQHAEVAARTQVAPSASSDSVPSCSMQTHRGGASVCKEADPAPAPQSGQARQQEYHQAVCAEPEAGQGGQVSTGGQPVANCIAELRALHRAKWQATTAAQKDPMPQDALPAMTDPMPVPSAGKALMLDTAAAKIAAAHDQTPELPVADEDAPHPMDVESAGIPDISAATKDADAARSPPTPRVILSGPLEQLRSNMTLAPFTINFSAQKQATDMQAPTTMGVLGSPDSAGKVDRKRKGPDSLQDIQGGKQQKHDEKEQADLQSIKIGELSRQPGANTLETPATCAALSSVLPAPSGQVLEASSRLAGNSEPGEKQQYSSGQSRQAAGFWPTTNHAAQKVACDNQAAAVKGGIDASEPGSQQSQVERCCEQSKESPELTQTVTCHNNVRVVRPGTSNALGCPGSQDGDKGVQPLSSSVDISENCQQTASAGTAAQHCKPANQAVADEAYNHKGLDESGKKPDAPSSLPDPEISGKKRKGTMEEKLAKKQRRAAAKLKNTEQDVQAPEAAANPTSTYISAEQQRGLEGSAGDASAGPLVHAAAPVSPNAAADERSPGGGGPDGLQGFASSMLGGGADRNHAPDKVASGVQACQTAHGGLNEVSKKQKQEAPRDDMSQPAKQRHHAAAVMPAQQGLPLGSSGMAPGPSTSAAGVHVNNFLPGKAKEGFALLRRLKELRPQYDCLSKAERNSKHGQELKQEIESKGHALLKIVPAEVTSKHLAPETQAKIQKQQVYPTASNLPMTGARAKVTNSGVTSPAHEQAAANPVQNDHAGSAPAPATAALEQPMPSALVHKQQPKSQLQTKAPVIAHNLQGVKAAASKQPMQQRFHPADVPSSSAEHICPDYAHAAAPAADSATAGSKLQQEAAGSPALPTKPWSGFAAPQAQAQAEEPWKRWVLPCKPPDGGAGTCCLEQHYGYAKKRDARKVQQPAQEKPAAKAAKPPLAPKAAKSKRKEKAMNHCNKCQFCKDGEGEKCPTMLAAAQALSYVNMLTGQQQTAEGGAADKVNA